jgi:addiction module RelE/StbE family toxin
VNIVWTAPARRDLREIHQYIAKDNPHAAQRLQAQIRERVTLLGRHPQLGRPGRLDGTRELVMADNPYILAYRIQSARIEILAVYHGARRWPEAL